MACLFFGALISPTDPIAVLELLRRVGVPRNVQAQLAGESLFNDGVGAVLFIALLEASRGATPSAADVMGGLVLKAGGGLLLGVALAWGASALMRAVDAYQIEILMTIALAVGGYAMAERLHVSAPLEAVAAGIALRRFNLNHVHGEIAHERLDSFWEVIDEVQNAVLFVLLGLMILAIPFSGLALRSGGVAILVVTLVRLAVVGRDDLGDTDDRAGIFEFDQDTELGRPEGRVVAGFGAFCAGAAGQKLDTGSDLLGGAVLDCGAGRIDGLLPGTEKESGMKAEMALALLRGINVGGKNILPMKALAEMFAVAGVHRRKDIYPERQCGVSPRREEGCREPGAGGDCKAVWVEGAGGDAVGCGDGEGACGKSISGSRCGRSLAARYVS